MTETGRRMDIVLGTLQMVCDYFLRTSTGRGRTAMPLALIRLTLLVAAFSFSEICLSANAADTLSSTTTIRSEFSSCFRSPVSVAILSDEKWLVTANQASGTVSLINLVAACVTDELDIGRRPTSIVARNQNGALAIASESGDLVAIDCSNGRLTESGRIHVGYEPHSVGLSPDGCIAYVTLSAVHQVAIVDVVTMTLIKTLDVGQLPRSLAVSIDGKLIAVTCSGKSEVVLIDALTHTVHSRYPFRGLNLGQPAFTPDSTALYFPWTYDGGSYPSPGNIRRGWVTGSRLGRIRFHKTPDALQGLTLDVSGKAVGDVFGLMVTDQGRSLLISAGGTHELLRLIVESLPFGKISGTEVMEPSLAANATALRRLQLGGRPLGMCASQQHRRVYVANSLLDAVQEIDLDTYAVTKTVSLDRDVAPTQTALLERQGEAIFYDATRSLDQWYSCHTCHFEGGGNTVTMDTLNDGSTGSYKTVLPLYGVSQTGPWTWHGWQNDLHASLRKSLIETMQGPSPTTEDVDALLVYLTATAPPPSPFRERDGSLSPAALRGEKLFQSDRAGCSHCHSGNYLTSSEVYDVGLIRSEDQYPGFSPPALAGVFRKTIFLHHGKAKSLREVLAGLHSPEKTLGHLPFSEEEMDDLIAYLQCL